MPGWPNAWPRRWPTARMRRGSCCASPKGATPSTSMRGTRCVAARLVESPPPALVEAARLVRHAPWLVANLQLDAALDDRPGAPLSWDNVLYDSTGLGYVDAM